MEDHLYSIFMTLYVCIYNTDLFWIKIKMSPVFNEFCELCTVEGSLYNSHDDFIFLVFLP